MTEFLILKHKKIEFKQKNNIWMNDLEIKLKCTKLSINLKTKLKLN